MQIQPSRRAPKRRLADDQQEHTTLDEHAHQRARMRRGQAFARGSVRHLTKRQQKVPEAFGQQLSMERTLETLDKESLQKLVASLVSAKPELAQDVMRLSPKVSPEDAIQVLTDKLSEIVQNMPYKVDPASDYAFLRVKTYVADLFQALSEYTLSFLPPVENDLTVSVQFLVTFLTDVFPKLPAFQAVEFRYYNRLTVEKLDAILLDVVTQFVSDRKQNILLVMNDGWLDRLDKVNELNSHQFPAAAEYLRREVDQYRSSGAVILEGASPEEEQAAETAKLQGLGSLLNFSNDNSPLNTYYSPL